MPRTKPRVGRLELVLSLALVLGAVAFLACTVRVPPPDDGLAHDADGPSPADPTLRTGTLSADETWRGLVVVTGEVVVPEGRSLAIAPNAHVQFSVGAEPSAKIVVEGGLYAEGDFQRPVLFTAERRTSQWHGVLLEEGSSARFTNAHFQFEAGVVARTTSARFSYCEFADNSSAALTIEAAAPTVEDSVFRANGVGIRVLRQAAPEILNSTIIGNVFGIVVEDGSQPTIARNVIANNRQHGVVSQGASSPNITSNNIVRNGGYAVLDGGRLVDNFIQGNNGGPPALVETSLSPQGRQVFGVEEVLSARPSPVPEAGDRRIR
jgi:parallel beta-helix repeat protein